MTAVDDKIGPSRWADDSGGSHGTMFHATCTPNCLRVIIKMDHACLWTWNGQCRSWEAAVVQSRRRKIAGIVIGDDGTKARVMRICNVCTAKMFIVVGIGTTLEPADWRVHIHTQLRKYRYSREKPVLLYAWELRMSILDERDSTDNEIVVLLKTFPLSFRFF